MSNSKTVVVIDGHVYTLSGDSTKGYHDNTGSPISGGPEHISGDRINGFRDKSGSFIELKEVKKGK